MLPPHYYHYATAAAVYMVEYASRATLRHAITPIDYHATIRHDEGHNTAGMPLHTAWSW